MILDVGRQLTYREEGRAGAVGLPRRAHEEGLLCGGGRIIPAECRKATSVLDRMNMNDGMTGADRIDGTDRKYGTDRKRGVDAHHGHDGAARTPLAHDASAGRPTLQIMLLLDPPGGSTRSKPSCTSCRSCPAVDSVRPSIRAVLRILSPHEVPTIEHEELHA
jgi:hypothetical protein